MCTVVSAVRTKNVKVNFWWKGKYSRELKLLWQAGLKYRTKTTSPTPFQKHTHAETHIQKRTHTYTHICPLVCILWPAKQLVSEVWKLVYNNNLTLRSNENTEVCKGCHEAISGKNTIYRHLFYDIVLRGCVLIAKWSNEPVKFKPRLRLWMFLFLLMHSKNRI